jgi:hypothetical protein
MARGSSKTTETPKFFISNEDMQLKQEIINISGHLGLSYGQFLRQKIREIRNSYPEAMRRRPSEV